MNKLLASLFAILLATPASLSLAAGAPDGTWAHEGSDLKPDPKTIFGGMENGLRYVILPNAEPPKRVSMRLHLAAGSLMEADDQQGLAHFMEHMAFNGTKHFPADEMVQFFQHLGMAFGADTNAHTSFDETVYKLEMPDNNAGMLGKGMLFMRDVADGILIGEQEIEKERGVIMSEKNARDSVEYRTGIEGLKFGLPESVIPRRLPIGIDDVILKAPKQRFVDFYRKWYTSARMTLIVVGDVQVDAVKKLIAEHFTDVKAPAVNTQNPDLGKVTTGKGLAAKLHTEKEAGQVTIQVNAAQPSRRLPDNTAARFRTMVRQLANAMLNRRFEVLAKKPDASFLAAQSSYEDWLHFVESASLEISARPENWEKALSTGEQELRRAVLHGFNQSELAQVAANLMTAAENAAAEAPTRKSRGLADAISNAISERKVFVHPADFLALLKSELPKITPAQCHEALKVDWDTEDIRIFIGGNLTLKEPEDTIANAWKKSRGIEVAPQKDDADAAWAYTNFGEPGKIAVQKEVADLEITQVQFGNGVRLNVKPTPDFKKDTIEIAINFGEGRLTAPKDKPGFAEFTQALFESGALGKHSNDDLQRVLAGKTVSLNFGVGDDSFTLSGGTNRKDLGTQFQVLAAFISDPGWREDSVGRFRMGLSQQYQRMEHTPAGVMKAKVNAFTHSDDYRFIFPRQEELAARTMAEMRAWLEPQLKSGYMEIGVVGDLNVQEVVTAAAQTIGALPSREVERRTGDELRKVAFPAGTPDKEFAFDSKIPSSIALVFWPTTDRRRDIKLSRQLSLLAEVFSDRVRIKVREELGESYSPDVASMMSDSWDGYGQVMAMMTADAKHAKQLCDIAKELGRAFAAKGATADELERARKPLLTSLEEQRRNNAYWLGTVVMPSQSKPERLEWARTMVDDFKSVSLADINRLAKEYLKADRATAVRVVSTGKADAGNAGNGAR